MTPEQIRAKQKLIAAYRHVISGIEDIKKYSVVLIPGEPSLLQTLDQMKGHQQAAREALGILESIPDTAELFVVGPTVRVDLTGYMELPPEGPGITEPPTWPGNPESHAQIPDTE